MGLLAFSSYSYSEQQFGSATVSATDWVMRNVLPQQAGLTVDSVFYRYTTVKNPEDFMIVSVQNEDALGDGYIFQEKDDWTGIPGNTINKLVSTGAIPIERWGNGSISVEGTGTVEDPSVVYNYKFEPCFDPQSDPACPGYIDYTAIYQGEFSDPLDDPLIKQKLEEKAELDDKEEERKNSEKKAEKKEKRLELALGAANTALETAAAAAAAAELIAMGAVPQNYTQNLPGGKYEETLSYGGKKLPDNAKGRRVGLAQQLLHEELVRSQYEPIGEK